MNIVSVILMMKFFKISTCERNNYNCQQKLEITELYRHREKSFVIHENINGSYFLTTDIIVTLN